ncbi:MerR family transcriptional regulator [Nocardia mangyaensis]|uniref:MerR family transcriptional regulator n=1 Tax=Nocardia mangyaensis TaxID=2213200 RepID=UPI0026765835|nr:MerR family DNA-binding transcriptional regulator [Nocardia mangyaensis]MDO3649522.1 MerR family DNA-binding transcriptional regulator [Nocardia mangyaensis]
MSNLRPADLAREHGLSPQAVRNYEREGFLPPAGRTASGYRIYTEAHAAALRAYLTLVPAYGYAAAGQIMRAVNDDDLDTALTIIDRGHGQLLRDRETLRSVRGAVEHVITESEARPAFPGGTRTIGELAHRLDVTPATLRAWEHAGILTPDRDPATGYRRYDAADLRDADLAHLLRRGGYLLDQIAAVLAQVRTAGGTDALATALADWQERLTTQGLTMLDAAAALSAYTALHRTLPAHRTHSVPPRPTPTPTPPPS